ncbi:exonuclease domain-containing protein [Gluconobacter sp. OJB]|uniref:exonuclease domain-containing protein n=1 Tax=Gluconobacter sp. OJB TaxID=3145196 RepID=UPI0031F7DEB9
MDNSLPLDRTLEALADRLEASEDYRVLRRMRPSVLSHKPEGKGLRTGLFVNLKTTGLDPHQDEIIEIGMIPFIYRIDGLLLGTLPAFSQLRKPFIPVPAFVQDLTELTPKRLAGQTVSPDEVAAFTPDASLMIAHNATFDRPFLECFCLAFMNNPWDQAGFEERKLGRLGLQAGFFFDGHRAVDDCQAAITLLGHTDFPKNHSALSPAGSGPKWSGRVCGPNMRPLGSKTRSRPVITAGMMVLTADPKLGSSTDRLKQSKRKFVFFAPTSISVMSTFPFDLLKPETALPAGSEVALVQNIAECHSDVFDNQGVS